MVAAKIRQNARESLTEKWGKAALITLCFILFEFAIVFLAGVLSVIPFLGFLVQIVNVIISLPLSYGLVVSFMKLKRGEPVAYFDFVSFGCSKTGRVWGVYGNILLKILPVFIVLVIAFILFFTVSFQSFSYGLLSRYSFYSTTSTLGALGIICWLVIIGCIIYLLPKTLLYSLSYMLLHDHNEWTGKEIVEESARLMRGHRWNLFWLNLTFIGWAILAIFTLYIGYFWLIPYMMMAIICFYEELAGITSSDSASKVVTDSKPDSDESNDPIKGE